MKQRDQLLPIAIDQRQTFWKGSCRRLRPLVLAAKEVNAPVRLRNAVAAGSARLRYSSSCQMLPTAQRFSANAVRGSRSRW